MIHTRSGSVSSLGLPQTAHFVLLPYWLNSNALPCIILSKKLGRLDQNLNSFVCHYTGKWKLYSPFSLNFSFQGVVVILYSKGLCQSMELNADIVEVFCVFGLSMRYEATCMIADVHRHMSPKVYSSTKRNHFDNAMLYVL